MEEAEIVENNPPVYSERTIITIQPNSYHSSSGVRNPIPVTTGLHNGNIGSYIPLTGLQFLAGNNKVDIQQTVELHDLLATIESENRYIIKTAEGDTIYVGAETSSDCQRLCCGTSRGFQLNLLDPTSQAAITFKRRLACSLGILGCFLQRIDVNLPSGDFIGCVEQEWTMLIPHFIIKDEFNKKLYHMEGPKGFSCAKYKDCTFQVLSTDTSLPAASISYNWEFSLISIVFLSDNMENKKKALIIGAAFLLEYMFFERSKKKRWCSC